VLVLVLVRAGMVTPAGMLVLVLVLVRAGMVTPAGMDTVLVQVLVLVLVQAPVLAREACLVAQEVTLPDLLQCQHRQRRHRVLVVKQELSPGRQWTIPLTTICNRTCFRFCYVPTVMN
jgi:hypothetical protein